MIELALMDRFASMYEYLYIICALDGGRSMFARVLLCLGQVDHACPASSFCAPSRPRVLTMLARAVFLVRQVDGSFPGRHTDLQPIITWKSSTTPVSTDFRLPIPVEHSGSVVDYRYEYDVHGGVLYHPKLCFMGLFPWVSTECVLYPGLCVFLLRRTLICGRHYYRVHALQITAVHRNDYGCRPGSLSPLQVLIDCAFLLVYKRVCRITARVRDVGRLCGPKVPKFPPNPELYRLERTVLKPTRICIPTLSWIA